MRLRLACLGAILFLSGAADASARDRIAFDHTAQDGTEDILAIDAGGGHARALTHMPPGGGAELPAWSPDGAALYFDSDLAGGVHLFATDALGRGPAQITRGDGTEFSPRPSPDGRLLAFEHEDAALSVGGIFVARERYGLLSNARRLTQSPALASGGFDTAPDFSPEGGRIAFLRVLSATPGSAQSAVFVIGLDGRGLRQLTPYSLNAIAPRWSPDAARILFSSNADNASTALSANVYTVRPDGSGLAQVTHEPPGGHAFTPDWSPDGRRIVYARIAPGEDHQDLVVRDLRTGATATIWRGAPGASDQDPDWQG